MRPPFLAQQLCVSLLLVDGDVFCLHSIRQKVYFPFYYTWGLAPLGLANNPVAKYQGAAHCTAGPPRKACGQWTGQVLALAPSWWG